MIYERKLFQISYIDPETEVRVIKEKYFSATKDFSARYWAEDAAYMWADKGRYEIKEMS